MLFSLILATAAQHPNKPVLRGLSKAVSVVFSFPLHPQETQRERKGEGERERRRKEGERDEKEGREGWEREEEGEGGRGEGGGKGERLIRKTERSPMFSTTF